jgi:hypothetical protein
LAECDDGVTNPTAGETCEGAGTADAPCFDCSLPACDLDPVASALTACNAFWTTCVEVAGGVVGFDPPNSQGSNCGPTTHLWRFYCTADEAGTANYNCSACTVGEILAAHEPCSCTAGSSPVQGTFCAP